MAVPQPPPEKMMFQLALRRRGISNQAVLRTLEEVPREAFVEKGDLAYAYRDRDHDRTPGGPGKTGPEMVRTDGGRESAARRAQDKGTARVDAHRDDG